MNKTITLKEFLKKEVKPALGCTEPGAVALAAARAAQELPDREDVASVHVNVSTSIYKNGMAVGIPGTRGARGNGIAAALGAICGEADLELQVLKNSTDEDVRKAEKWVEDGRIIINNNVEKTGVYILATVFTPSHKATCLITGSHSHISATTLDGVARFTGETDDNKPAAAQNNSGFEDDGFPKTLSDALMLADEMDLQDQIFLLEGAEMNQAVAEAGYSSKEECASCGECVQGSRFGKALLNFAGNGKDPDIAVRIKIASAAASDARMSGVLMPIMSSAGSGNHGITAILPVYMLGKDMHKGDDEIARAIAISHLATSFVKRQMGRLSSACGCAVAAGAGAAAGMTSLLGGDLGQISCAMGLLLANLTGMLCDGAKESCALKVAAAASEAYYSAIWAISGETLCVPQGVFGASIEETVYNVGEVTKNGMRNVDNSIVEILDKRYKTAR